MHHTAPLALLAAIDWSYVVHQSPARIIAIAAAVYAFLQGVKQFFPLLTGYWAIAANVLLSGAGILAVTPTDQLLTPATLSSLVVAILTAAGIHGTVSKLQAPSPSGVAGSSPSSASGPTTAGKALVILLAVGASFAVVALTGCDDFERSTYRTLAASQAVVNQAQTDYEANTIAQTMASYTAINKAKAAQVVAVQAMAAYEQIKSASGTQSALQAQQAVVQNLVNQLPALVAAVKALYTNSPATVAPAPTPTGGLRVLLPTAA